MIKLITFSDDNMSQSAIECTLSATRNGVDFALPQTKKDISNEFFITNEDILRSERGCGYWLWKPYLIHKAMFLADDNSILIYSDAGVKWIANVNEIISRMDQDIFLFSNGHSHVHWCKGDVLKSILGWPIGEEISIYNEGWLNYDFSTHQQVQASVIFFKVNQNTRNFIKEWLLWCQMPGMIDDSPSNLPNHPEFAEHRHDQAILTCLAIKYGYKLHYWADERWYSTQRHRWPGDDYPLMFDHHRFRDKGKGGGLNPEWE